MALNIPNTGAPGEGFLKGLDSGSSLFQKIMQPRIAREQMQQQQQQFLQNLELRKQAMARAGANSDLQRQILQQQLLGLQHKNNPIYEYQQFQALQNMMTGGGQNQGEIFSIQQQPTQEMGEGMGMFSPEGLQEAQQQPQQPPMQPQSQGEINLNMFRQNPMLRGFFKKKFGYDPLEQAPQTSQEKQADALNLFKQKESIKAQNKSGNIATNKVLTQNQQSLQAIDTVLPMVDEFINNPNSIYGVSDFSRSKKAAYNAKTGGMIDMLVAAQSLPQVQASIDLVEQQIRRATGETTSSYIKRLKDFRKDLMQRRIKSSQVINSKKINTENLNDLSKMSEEELQRIAGGG
jgi:hypothetical protein